MFNHAPASYTCPFCQISARIEHDLLHTQQCDIVFRDDSVIGFVASHWWPKNKGHVLVIPAAHFENLYDLPDKIGAEIHAATRLIAIAMKQAYTCEGVSTRQHNEPAGYQEVWHYHVHVFPRFINDNLYSTGTGKYLTTATERLTYAVRLRDALRKFSCDVPAEISA